MQPTVWRAFLLAEDEQNLKTLLLLNNNKDDDDDDDNDNDNINKNNDNSYISNGLFGLISTPRDILFKDLIVTSNLVSNSKKKIKSSLFPFQFRENYHSTKFASKIFSPNWNLSKKISDILADPLNLNKFPIINILNAFEFLNILKRYYLEFWDRNINNKCKIVTERFDRLISAFMVTLAHIVRELKCDYTFAENLSNQILNRCNEILKCSDEFINHVTPFDENDNLIIKNPGKDNTIKMSQNIKALIKDKCLKNLHMIHIGSMYDVLLGKEIMSKINKLIIDEYQYLIRISIQGNIQFYDVLENESDDNNIALDRVHQNLKNDKQLIFSNYRVQGENNHYYCLWNFLTLMANKNKTNRHLLADLMFYDMVVLLGCIKCSTNLAIKIKTTFELYHSFLSTHKTEKEKINKLIQALKNILLQNNDNQNSSIEYLFIKLIKWKWSDPGDPVDIRGARKALINKTKARMINNEITREDSNNNNRVLCDAFAFLSFYLIFLGSMMQDEIEKVSSSSSSNSSNSSSNSSSSNDNSNSSKSSNSNDDIGSLLSLAGIWALRNSIRISYNKEPYPLNIFLSGFGNDLLPKILNCKFIKNINIKYVFSKFLNQRSFNNLSAQGGIYNEQEPQISFNQKGKRLLLLQHEIGTEVLSKEKIENIKLEDWLKLNIFPLTEYEVYTLK
uniref:Wsv327-like protein n=1 Tax=Metapenaeus ensis majanivirus TaxID=2984279 RepID=A0A9C7BMX4_9VIRU|nr:MAG: wsv327-like protein [Metapenaeus ensis majanivirus]